MRICFLAPANNYHTLKWCSWFVNRGHDVYVISFTKGNIEGVKTYIVNSKVDVNDSDKKKIKYLFLTKTVREYVHEIAPDIINVHYATSYGTIAALAKLKGYILSVWGADIYDFPNKSFLHKMMLKYSLYHATYLFSTSQAMAVETSKYIKKKIYITPFGVDMNLFNPNKRSRQEDNKFIVGNIKALNRKYGIDTLLRATKYVVDLRPDINVEVRIAGKGPEEGNLKDLASELGIANRIVWLGFIQQSEVAKEWANMDIAVISSSSYSESFGVSVVEAQASGTFAIISDIPGLKEASSQEIADRAILINDYESLAYEIIYMYDNPEERYNIAINARNYVFENYEINDCFKKIEAFYKKIVN